MCLPEGVCHYVLGNGATQGEVAQGRKGGEDLDEEESVGGAVVRLLDGGRAARCGFGRSADLLNCGGMPSPWQFSKSLHPGDTRHGPTWVGHVA